MRNPREQIVINKTILTESMELDLRDYYRFFEVLPIADDQVKFHFKDQMEVFGDKFRRIVFNVRATDDVDQLIEEVVQEFKEFEIRWKVADTDQPDVDWVKKLEDYGFEPTVSEMGMIFDLDGDDLDQLLQLKERLNNDIEIVELKTEGLVDEEFFDLKIRTFDRDREVVQFGLDVYFQLEKKGLKHQHLIAKSDDKWVGHGVLSYVEDSEVAFLAGAMTDRDFRKRGIYSTMLARRAAHAIQVGKKYLVINAVANTSTPILQKVGFRTIGEQKIMKLVKSRFLPSIT